MQSLDLGRTTLKNVYDAVIHSLQSGRSWVLECWLLFLKPRPAAGNFRTAPLFWPHGLNFLQTCINKASEAEPADTETSSINNLIECPWGLQVQGRISLSVLSPDPGNRLSEAYRLHVPAQLNFVKFVSLFSCLRCDRFEGHTVTIV